MFQILNTDKFYLSVPHVHDIMVHIQANCEVSFRSPPNSSRTIASTTSASTGTYGALGPTTCDMCLFREDKVKDT